VVNALAILDENEWLKYKKIAKEYQDQGRIVEFSEKNVEEFNADVTYQQINPTKYKVSVNGLKGPAFLVFSESFDKLWKLNNQSSLPVYGFLNGFSIEMDGEYIVEFEPQKYVYPGLVISGIMTICLSLFFLRQRLSNHR
ncbi:MAG: hypothetical protein Q7R43_00675, partial [Candidatus Daviesbacteria bacterium]|nr:hypothetical protein [Candidatus Daviesbacteria bacterium]